MPIETTKYVFDGIVKMNPFKNEVQCCKNLKYFIVILLISFGLYLIFKACRRKQTMTIFIEESPQDKHPSMSQKENHTIASRPLIPYISPISSHKVQRRPLNINKINNLNNSKRVNHKNKDISKEESISNALYKIIDGKQITKHGSEHQCCKNAGLSADGVTGEKSFKGKNAKQDVSELLTKVLSEKNNIKNPIKSSIKATKKRDTSNLIGKLIKVFNLCLTKYSLSKEATADKIPVSKQNIKTPGNTENVTPSNANLPNEAVDKNTFVDEIIKVMSDQTKNSKYNLDEIFSQILDHVPEKHMHTIKNLLNNIMPNDSSPDETILNEVISNEIIANVVIPNTVIPNTVIPNTVIPIEVIPNKVIPNKVIPNKVIPNTVIPNAVIPNNKTIRPICKNRKPIYEDVDDKETTDIRIDSEKCKNVLQPTIKDFEKMSNIVFNTVSKRVSSEVVDHIKAYVERSMMVDMFMGKICMNDVDNVCEKIAYYTCNCLKESDLSLPCNKNSFIKMIIADIRNLAKENTDPIIVIFLEKYSTFLELHWEKT
jgi:hypothetical protein